MKNCSSCHRQKGLAEFSKNKSKPDGMQSICKTCKKAYNKKYYTKTKDRYKDDRALARNEQRKNNQKWLFDYLTEHSCVDCGNQDVRVLEFDHLPQFKKDNEVTTLLKYSLDRVKAEVDKCEVVCVNCHRIRTLERLDSCWRIDLGL